jgi:ribosomal protein L6P/L9E
MSLTNKHNLIKIENDNQEKFIISKIEFPDVFFSKYKGKYILGNSNNQQYIKMSSAIVFDINENSITFISKDIKNKSVFVKFIENLKNFLFTRSFLYTKRVRIRGLGYKVLKEENSLIFRLGYSKQILVSIPDQLEDFVIKKNLLIVKSLDKNFLGNFAHFLIGLKKRDIYKGKGLSLEYKLRKLKPVKKK